MEERIDLLVVEKRRAGGITLAIAVSFVLHISLAVWFVRSYRPMAAPKHVPMTRYVELIQQNPQTPREFVEAPGPRLDRAPRPEAPLSDANRKASAPFPPNGDQPTSRPGDGGGVYQPQPNPAPRGGAAPAVPQPQTSAAEAAAAPQDPQQQPRDFAYREHTGPVAKAAAAAPVDWRSVVRDVHEVGKIASLGGGDGIELGGLAGGEKGTFEQGPLSFESQWYDWGEYAQSMVSKIRVHWYANMPQLIRSGMKGVVTIRFTIQRDGRITDVTILETSGVPPYDHAAKKAIELASPLAPLPKDFPNAYERVTAMFFYNTPVPRR